MRHRLHLKGPVERFTRLDSTNLEALRRARENAPTGLIVRADCQDGGRGQRQRSWHSPPGGLWFTVLLRPTGLEGLSLAAGLACVRVARRLGAAASLRWPNDVYVGERKLAGILTETRMSGSRIESALIGVGLNVNLRAEDFPEDLRPLATSLATEVHRTLDLDEVFERLLDELDRVLDLHIQAGLAGLLPEIRESCSTLGRRVRLLTREGPLVARARTLGPDGSLELDDGSCHYSVERVQILPED